MLPILIVLFLLLLACFCMATPLIGRKTRKVAHSPAEFGLDYSEVQFNSADGVPLTGWWIPSGGSRRTVIFLHGYSGSMDPDLQYAPDFHARGFNVLMFDFRAHSRSGGRYTSVGPLEIRDVHGALEFARSRGSDSVGLMGFSMGGRAAILAAAASSEFDAVISDCAPLRLLTAMRASVAGRGLPGLLSVPLACLCLLGASLRLGVNLFARDPLRVLGGIHSTPILLIFGGRDPYTRANELHTIRRKTGKNVRIWFVPEGHHREVDLLDRELYIRTVTDFFTEHLKST